MYKLYAIILESCNFFEKEIEICPKKLLQDGEVSTEEFMKAIQTNCVGKAYADFPSAFKTFIAGAFGAIDVDGNFNGILEFFS